jgi:hypothetical protein
MEAFKEAALTLEGGKGPGVDPGTVDDLAKIHLMESFGLSSSEIAWEFLAERHPEVAPLDDEVCRGGFLDEHAKEMDRLRQVRNRGLERVTHIVPLLSRLSD